MNFPKICDIKTVVSIFRIFRRDRRIVRPVERKQQPPIEGAVILFAEQIRYPDGAVEDLPPKTLSSGNPYLERPKLC